MDDQAPSSPKLVDNHPDSVNAVPVGENEQPAPHKYEVPPKYRKNQSKKGRYIFIFLAILLIAASVYWFLLKPKPVKEPAANNGSAAKSSQSSQAKLDTTHYESSNFNLGLDYPKSWKLSDVSGSGKLIITSPAMKLKDTSGQQVDGQIIMTVRDKTQKLSEFDKGAATAIIDSEKVTYTKPSETQRGDTYISFLNYASSSGDGLDAVYISGDAGYQKNQAVPAVDISKIDPITNVTFVKCSDSKCSGNGTALTVGVDNWHDSSFSKPIKTLLQSLAIQ
jgi:hypothetical protein